MCVCTCVFKSFIYKAIRVVFSCRSRSQYVQSLAVYVSVYLSVFDYITQTVGLAVLCYRVELFVVMGGGVPMIIASNHGVLFRISDMIRLIEGYNYTVFDSSEIN